jgi:hypothetical protein
MAKKFSGFTDDQALILLNKVGFPGQSMQADEVSAFLAANPNAQAKLGQYAAAAQKRLDMLTTPTTGYAVGGLQTAGMGGLMGNLLNQPQVAEAMQANQNKGVSPGMGGAAGSILGSFFSGGGGPSPAQPLQPQEAQQTGTYGKGDGTTIGSGNRLLEPPLVSSVLPKDGGPLVPMPGGGIDLGFNAETPSSLRSNSASVIPTGQPPTPMRPVATPEIQTARQSVVDQQAALGTLQQAYAAIDPKDTAAQATAKAAIDAQQAKVAGAQAGLNTAQTNYQTLNMPSLREAQTAALSDPLSMTTTAAVDQIQATPDQKIDPTTGQLTGTTPTIDASTATTATPVAAPIVAPAATIAPTAASPEVQGTLDKLQAATGLVGADALVQAATMTPDQLAALGISVEQIAQARTVIAPPARVVQDGEMIAGSTVDMAAVDKAVNFEAATGAPSSAGTVQGQLTSLMQDFEGDKTPAWAAGAMRAATAALASRGLGASTMAGQAIIQATMESALPIAQQDAQTNAGFEMQNLSNRQATAMFGAQQRAQFLGIEFDQKFQTRVANSSRIADIANMNFNADQQIALENARMAQTVDLTNLNAKNAKIMADAATLSQMDMTNLNNRQQAAVTNAQSFLQMDMQNLNNEQQTSVFKAQSMVNTLLSDTAASNAAKQFNATSENQTNQFFSSLTSTVAQFNVDQSNAMARFNAGETNTIAQFNSQLENQREQFNSTNSLVIEQANTQWAQTIATANNASLNAANRDAAIAANGLTSTTYNNLLQKERDIMSYAFQTANNNADRATNLALGKISADASITAADRASEGSKASGLAQASGTILAAMFTGGFL